MLRKRVNIFFMGIFDFCFWLEYTCSLHGSGCSQLLVYFVPA